MSLQAAILASLMLDKCSGYELSKEHVNSCVSIVWQVPQQQIYRELKKMEESGWILSHQLSPEKQMGKKVYEVTALGKAQLTEWISQPVEPSATREAILIKMFAGYLAQPDVLLLEIERHRQQHQAQLEQLEGILNKCEESEKPLDYGAKLTHQLLKHRLGEERNWVDWCEETKSILRTIDRDNPSA